MKNRRPGNPQLLFLAVLAICGAAITGCGGGDTKTVTVTTPAPGSSRGETTSSAGSRHENKTVTEEAGAVAGYVDNIVSESGTLKLLGWAAAPDLSAPATKVTATVAGKAVAAAVPAIERADVVEALGKPGVKDSGFELNLPSEVLDCGAPASGIKVTAEFEGRSGPVEFGEGIKPKLNEAC